MNRPQNTNPNDNLDILRDSDTFEMLQGSVSPVRDSASSAKDAGLIDAMMDKDTDEELEQEESMEIPMSDLDIEPAELHMPEMSDMDNPGEIDIEELDEETIEAALPPDARLDHIQP